MFELCSTYKLVIVLWNFLYTIGIKKKKKTKLPSRTSKAMLRSRDLSIYLKRQNCNQFPLNLSIWPRNYLKKKTNKINEKQIGSQKIYLHDIPYNRKISSITTTILSSETQ